MDRPLPQPVTSGASAISGTVWLSTIHGSSARSSTCSRSMISASASPTTTPITKPTPAHSSEFPAAESTDSNTVGAEAPRTMVAPPTSCARKRRSPR